MLAGSRIKPNLRERERGIAQDFGEEREGEATSREGGMRGGGGEGERVGERVGEEGE
jgi:hypothetical protein